MRKASPTPSVPDLGPGVCRYCGCSEFDPCENGCAWADRRQTVCSECTAAHKAASAAIAGGVAGKFARVWLRGFVVGWFKVTPARNPYFEERKAHGGYTSWSRAWSFAWQGGRGAGERARAALLYPDRVIQNTPRAFVYERPSKPTPKKRKRAA